jgi:hypothetical protein
MLRKTMEALGQARRHGDGEWNLLWFRDTPAVLLGQALSG